MKSSNSLILICLTSCVLVSSFSIVVPDASVTAALGSDVILQFKMIPSVAVEDITEIKWTNLQLGKTVNYYSNKQEQIDKPDETYVNRSEILKDAISNGNLSVILKRVTTSDEGKYRCFAQIGDYLDSATVVLQVSAIGNTPVINVVSIDKQTAQLACSSSGWHPIPKLTWIDDRENILSDHREKTTITTEDSGTKALESDFQLQMSANVNVVSCMIYSPVGKKELRSSIKISAVPKCDKRYQCCFIAAGEGIILVFVCLIFIHFRRACGKPGEEPENIALLKKESQRCKAICNYEPKSGDELRLCKGDTIDILCELDDAWYYGKNKEFRGKFQKEYAEVIKDHKTGERSPTEESMEEKMLPRVCHITSEGWNNITKDRAHLELDQFTAYPFLKLTDKYTINGRCSIPRTETDEMFDTRHSVLTTEGFNSGIHYWEVEVGESVNWAVGVVRKSVKRKGPNETKIPQNGFWIFGQWKSSYFLTEGHSDTVNCKIFLSHKPRKIGLCLNYEKGQLDFYDACTRSHICSIIDTFSEKMFPFIDSWDPGSVITLIS